MPQMTLRDPVPASSAAAAPKISAGIGQQSLFGAVELNGAPMNFGRNAEIFGEGEDAEYVYKVLSGATRTYKVLNDGRRQIGAFYLPGDVFGLESCDAHSYSAEAIADSVVLVVRRSTLLRTAER